MMKSRTGGFTLVELLIVMVVASILMMIAIPSYQQAVIKSRRADARIALNDVAQRLERCYTQFGAYDAADCGIANGDEIASKEGFYLVTVTVAAVDGLMTYSLSAAPQGAQAADTDCGYLKINAVGVRSATGDNTAHCW
jgi:type IV pilus assembly protein PilE